MITKGKWLFEGNVIPYISFKHLTIIGWALFQNVLLAKDDL
jgi:hypothetical protein